MTENLQRTTYIIFVGVTSIVSVFLAIIWFMSPLGLGFVTWPEAHRDLFEQIYRVSYFGGIPAILIAQIASPFLFAFRKRRMAYWVPAVAITLLVACMTAVISYLGLN